MTDLQNSQVPSFEEAMEHISKDLSKFRLDVIEEKKRQDELKAAEEALNSACNDKILAPEDVAEWTDDEKLACYRRGL